ncbi:MAG: hypothetical protein WKF37_07060 [Bryobacteraceae bacterium]
MISGIDSKTSLQTAPAKPDKIEEAAQQFESLLLAQMLKSMRESGSGWLGTGEDASAESAVGLAEEQFAQALTASGGLGLTAMITKNLKAES